MSKGLRAKYFHDGNFWSNFALPTTSYAWKSIVQSCGVLELESRWNIGNGETVHVWKDKLIPRPSTFKIYTSMPLMLLYLQVKDLLLANGIRWDVVLL